MSVTGNGQEGQSRSMSDTKYQEKGDWQMKKVLWICNIMLPAIARELGMPYSNREGWLSGIYDKTLKGEVPFEITVCFPMRKEDIDKVPVTGVLDCDAAEAEENAESRSKGKRERNAGFLKIKGFRRPCYAFEEDLLKPENYDPVLEARIRGILKDVKPDMIHIFGTEFPHCLAAVRAFHNPQKTLIGIQGLCGEIAKTYRAGLPENVFKQASFRDVVKRDSMRQQQYKFYQRAGNERQALLLTDHITGRTEFDRAETAKINPRANYYSMNETMRQEFYEGRWKPEQTECHSIFLGQGDYPLKGMHFLLEAMGRLKENYPDLKLYVAGNSIISHETAKDRCRLSAYGKYLLVLIRLYELQDRVIVLGRLSAEEMKAQFLRSSVFVCPSVMENSPNTIGEAMLLGVPVVASRTGGIPSMVEDGVTGLLFHNEDVEDLADSIDRVWSDQVLAKELSAHERIRASHIHDGNKNYERLLEIYREILQ